MNETLTEEQKQLLKNIRLTFIAMVSMLGIFLLVAIVIAQATGALMPEINAYYNWLVIGVTAVSFVFLLLAKQRMTKAVASFKNSPDSLTEKLTKYRSALIVYISLSELPILLCIVLSLLTANFVFQVFAAVFIGSLLSALPSKEKVLRQLSDTGWNY